MIENKMKKRLSGWHLRLIYQKLGMENKLVLDQLKRVLRKNGIEDYVLLNDKEEKIHEIYIKVIRRINLSDMKKLSLRSNEMDIVNVECSTCNTYKNFWKKTENFRCKEVLTNIMLERDGTVVKGWKDIKNFIRGRKFVKVFKILEKKYPNMDRRTIEEWVKTVNLDNDIDVAYMKKAVTRINSRDIKKVLNKRLKKTEYVLYTNKMQESLDNLEINNKELREEVVKLKSQQRSDVNATKAMGMKTTPTNDYKTKFYAVLNMLIKIGITTTIVGIISLLANTLDSKMHIKDWFKNILGMSPINDVPKNDDVPSYTTDGVNEFVNEIGDGGLSKLGYIKEYLSNHNILLGVLGLALVVASIYFGMWLVQPKPKPLFSDCIEKIEYSDHHLPKAEHNLPNTELIPLPNTRLNNPFEIPRTTVTPPGPDSNNGLLGSNITSNLTTIEQVPPSHALAVLEKKSAGIQDSSSALSPNLPTTHETSEAFHRLLRPDSYASISTDFTNRPRLTRSLSDASIMSDSSYHSIVPYYSDVALHLQKALAPLTMKQHQLSYNDTGKLVRHDSYDSTGSNPCTSSPQFTYEPAVPPNSPNIDATLVDPNHGLSVVRKKIFTQPYHDSGIVPSIKPTKATTRYDNSDVGPSTRNSGYNNDSHNPVSTSHSSSLSDFDTQPSTGIVGRIRDSINNFSFDDV